MGKLQPLASLTMWAQKWYNMHSISYMDTKRHIIGLTVAVFVLAAAGGPLAISPGDRLAMADRLFERGKTQLAKAEYEALRNEKEISADELIYRLAECERALKNTQRARELYGELLTRWPVSRHANRARLQKALAGTDEEKRTELRLLDSDQVPAEIRAAALYHLGVLDNDAKAFAAALSVDPKGKYAIYSKFSHATLTSDDPDPTIRRTATRELVEIHFSQLKKDPSLARKALYMAGVRTYGDKRYGDSSRIFRRYLSIYPGDERAGQAKTMAAWSDYMSGKYADAAALCGDGGSDDADYLLAACAYAIGDRGQARERMAKYLTDHPQGRYREAVELPLARMDFEEAGKGEDASKAIDAALRGANLSGDEGDKLRLAWAYEKAGRDDDAQAVYEGIAKESPGTSEAAEALYRKALMDIRAAKWSAAELALAEAIASGKLKRREEALYWRGMAAFMLGHETEGAPMLKEALDSGKLTMDQNREARLMLADMVFKEEKVADAKAAYAQLVREGACERMSASKIRSVGRFLLYAQDGDDATAEALTCAKALYAKADTPQWKQAAKALEGAAEEMRGAYSAAIAAYRAAMAEDAKTEDAPDAALALGMLESKAGNTKEADAALRTAVALNGPDPTKRAKAYLWLAKNAVAAGDTQNACAYATVVITLFEDDEITAEAQKILDSAQAGETK